MQSETTQPREARWPHRLAVLLVCATFPLIWVGGLVTTTESGMAVPDYPTTFGYNMFLYPLETWLGGSWPVFIEHSHRLLGATCGLLTIALCIALWRTDERRWLRWLGVVALAAVIFQGLLGGFRVIENQRLLAMVHGCFGPAYFALTVALAVFTSRRWRGVGEVDSALTGINRLARAALIVAALAFAQILLGAQVRHVPVTASTGWFQTIIVFHVGVALALVAHVAWLAAMALRRKLRGRGVAGPAVGLAALLLVQVALGGGAWVLNYGWPRWFQDYDFAQQHLTVARSSGQNLITTAHVAAGSLILAAAVTLALRSGRLARGSRTAAVQDYVTQVDSTSRPAAARTETLSRQRFQAVRGSEVFG